MVIKERLDYLLKENRVITVGIIKLEILDRKYFIDPITFGDDLPGYYISSPSFLRAATPPWRLREFPRPA